MSRRQRVFKSPPVHPTHSRILEEAKIILNEDGFDLFNVQRVLDAANVSRGTLYHHFGDVDTLIEAALVETFRQELDHYLNLLVELIKHSPDSTTFRQTLRPLVQAFSTMPASVRLRRAHTIVLAATRPKLASAIASVQNSVTEAWEVTILELQGRGFVRADLNAHATAVMVQAITLGRIVDDAASNHLTHEQFADSFYQIIDLAILAPETPAETRY